MSSQGVRNTKRRRRRPMLTKQTSPSDALRRHFLSLPLLLAHLPPFCHSFSISQLNSSQFKSRPTLYDHWPIHLNSKSKQQQHLTSILISLSFIPFLLLFKIEFHQLSHLYYLFDLLSLWFFLPFFKILCSDHRVPYFYIIPKSQVEIKATATSNIFPHFFIIFSISFIIQNRISSII